jgi:hypothetical protein
VHRHRSKRHVQYATEGECAARAAAERPVAPSHGAPAAVAESGRADRRRRPSNRSRRYKRAARPTQLLRKRFAGELHVKRGRWARLLHHSRDLGDGVSGDEAELRRAALRGSSSSERAKGGERRMRGQSLLGRLSCFANGSSVSCTSREAGGRASFICNCTGWGGAGERGWRVFAASASSWLATLRGWRHEAAGATQLLAHALRPVAHAPSRTCAQSHIRPVPTATRTEHRDLQLSIRPRTPPLRSARPRTHPSRARPWTWTSFLSLGAAKGRRR